MGNIKNSGSTKFLVLLIILIAWAVFSVAYIGYDAWGDFKAQQLNQAVQQTQVQTINSIVSRAQQDCQPFTVNGQNDNVDLINVSCLQQQGEGQEQQQQPQQ